MKYTAYLDDNGGVFGINIKSCGHIFAKQGRESFRPNGRGDWLLLYVARGTETFFLDRETEAPAGSFIIFRPGEKQHHIHTETRMAEFYYIHFVTDDFSFSNLESSKIYTIEASAGICDLFEEMINDLYLKLPCYQRMSVFMFLKILGTLERGTASDTASYKHYLNKVENVVQRINSDYFENVSLEEYASMCNMSKYHFLRTFENITGISPIAYRNKIRIERAQRLLDDTELTIGKIGEKVGYSSQSYFCDAFKKECGISPKEYRKRNGK